MDSMDVALVSNVVYPFVKGGAERRVYEVGRRLAARGHDVTVYGRHFWEGPEVIDQEGVTLRAVAPGRELYVDDRRSIGEAVGFAARLTRPLLGSDHDLIDASVFPYFPVFPAAAAAVRTGASLVTTWHEVWGRYWLSYIGRLGYAGMAVERAAASLPQRPIAVSGRTADRLARLGVARERVAVVPNGIDVAGLGAVEPAADAPDVLFVGRLVTHKGVRQLIRAFDRVASGDGDGRGPSDIRLGIVGDGPERDRLATTAASLPSGDRITFYGTVHEDRRVYELMAGATVFASPSTREGFGMALLEAMATGCQVIAASHPESAVDEVIGDGGFLVDGTAAGGVDVAELARALAAVLDGRRAPTDPRTVAAQFDWERVVDDTERVYRDALECE
jgi:glycosyltransferase involved in cell wall biosynthesis